MTNILQPLMPKRGPGSSQWLAGSTEDRGFWCGAAMADDWKGLVLTIQTVGYTACGVEFGGCKGILHVDAEWTKHLVVGACLSIRNYQMQWYEGEIHFNATGREGAQLFLHASEKRGEVRTMETFAGIGGWSQVLSHFDDLPALMVEVDECTAKALARQMNVECITAEAYVHRVLSGSIFTSCVLVDSVENPVVWIAAGLANIGQVVGSPPCPPWSGAGTNKGLSCSDGVLFRSHLEWAATMRMRAVVLENVPGLARHTDFREIVRHAAEKGLIMLLHGCFTCHQILPVRRERWLATFVHKDVAVDDERVKIANAISFTNSTFTDLACEPKLQDADVVHMHCGVDERVELGIPREAMALLGDVEVAPWWLKSKVRQTDPDSLMHGRVVGQDEQCPCFMASYGKQHEIDVRLLRGKGLQTILFKDSNGVRMVSPWEMLAAMAYQPTTVLSGDIFQAWKQAGNGLTAAHAWLALHKTHVMLGGNSPWGSLPDPGVQLRKVLQDGIHMSKHATCKSEGFWWLVDCPCEPSTKKLRLCSAVPPTIPFTAVEGDESDPESPVGTKPFVRKPLFIQVNDPRCHAAFHGLGCNSMVVLEHVEKNWVMFVNVQPRDVVATAIKKGLPHAMPEHFVSLRIDDHAVEWTQMQMIEKKPVQTLVFDPMYVKVKCHEESLHIDLSFMSDVTWTGKTALAFCAREVGCSPDAVSLFHGNVHIPDTSFLAGYETTDFIMKFKACMPAYVSWEPHASQVRDLGFLPSGQEVRWFARHPNRKVVRTCSIEQDAAVCKLVQMLFPELHANTPWTVYDGGQEIDVYAKVGSLKHVEIQWNGARPFPITSVMRLSWNQELDTPMTQAKVRDDYEVFAIRSPHKVRVQELKCPVSVTIGEAAASFLALSKVQTSVLCMQNGMVLDPALKFRDVSREMVLDFRVCPLMGGAKDKMDPVKTKLKSMLVERGVPEEVVGERVAGLMAKVSHDKLSAVGDAQDSTTWRTVKEIASAAQYRLITPAELKMFQQKARKNKPSAETGDKKAKKFTPEAHAIQVDPTHVHADGQPVALIEPSRFGLDQTGLCIVTPSEAKQCLQCGAKSCDPLALLVVGEGVQNFGKPFSLPAHLVNGSPVVVRACLLQCGDVHIEFRLQLPMAEVTQMESTVIEFGIHKKYVRNWQDTTVPLHYVGVHVPALRGNNLLAVWSVKAWLDNKVVHHSQADHWHGYFRIADCLLPQVLMRSGAAGIFLNPKTAERKHDPRFTTVALPAKQLTEVAAKADACANALGVVKMGEGFAIRCRREDAAGIRAQLLPESAFVEMTAVPQDKCLYVARNVPQVGREELSLALQKTGWDATAVKPQGMDRWIIAAKDDPKSGHVVVNGSIMIVEKMHRQVDSTPISLVAREIRVNTVTDPQGTVSTTSRIAEFRAQVESQISHVVDAKLVEANAKIEQLTAALQEVQAKAEQSHSSLASDMNHVREEQAFTQKKLADVEASVAGSGQQILDHMHTMFSKMQASMEQTVQALVNDPEKRQRTEPSKSDPFTPKA